VGEGVRRVLYLEDEQDMVEYMPLLLREKGLAVIGTTSISEALTWFEEQEFDAVLLDIFMPPTDDMDVEALNYGRETGVEVARQMKKLKPQVPIVALTVVTDPEIQAHMREAGIDSVVNKPSDPDPIAETLLRVIR
jgi:CheY-like chemotaxis protein